MRKKADRLQGDGLLAGKAKEGENVVSTRAFAARKNCNMRERLDVSAFAGQRWQAKQRVSKMKNRFKQFEDDIDTNVLSLLSDAGFEAVQVF